MRHHLWCFLLKHHLYTLNVMIKKLLYKIAYHLKVYFCQLKYFCQLQYFPLLSLHCSSPPKRSSYEIKLFMKEPGFKKKTSQLKASISKRMWYSIQCAIMAEWN